ncbi:MAG: dTDP-4-dehydrorhamnose 3,5-epimerase [Gammaproteobacteria bacterium]|nr:dTDP-4-dehydrorhamnose 3,5-epimerase [Gammaproteobacteria bacterium]
MRFVETAIPGAYVVEAEATADDRGAFFRIWCYDELIATGLDAALAQCSISTNRRRGTLRGMHYQAAPHEEVKLVRCIRGRIFDVIVDLRPDSPTHRQWLGLELSAENRSALYVPAGCSHGFQTLEDDSEVLYHISRSYAPDHQRGHHYDDRKLKIAWPMTPTVVSEKDRALLQL